MKKLAFILLAAASLAGTAGVASAQWYGGGYYGGDQYRHRYRDYDDDDRYYRRRSYRRPSNVDCYGRVCPRGYTVQDCVCKPYRGY